MYTRKAAGVPNLLTMLLNPLAAPGALLMALCLCGSASANYRPYQRSSPSLPVVRQTGKAIVLHYDFRQGTLGWKAGFADYPKGQEPSFEMKAGPRLVPRELTPPAGNAFYFQGHNRSDDLFMFLTRRLTRAEGIRPGQKYRLHYSLALASDAQTGCAGIGGRPGESVYLKVGGATSQPKAIPGADDPTMLRLNADIGSQSQSGAAATTIGNIANGVPCSDVVPRPFAEFHREGTHTKAVTADANGNLYLLIGTDSGFEGLTRLFYRRIQIILTPVS